MFVYIYENVFSLTLMQILNMDCKFSAENYLNLTRRVDRFKIFGH